MQDACRLDATTTPMTLNPLAMVTGASEELASETPPHAARPAWISDTGHAYECAPPEMFVCGMRGR